MQEPDARYHYQGTDATSEQMYTTAEQTYQTYQQQDRQQQAFYQQEHRGQAPYGQPYYYMPTPMMGDGRLSAMLCYALGWFTGLLFLLFGGHNPYVRFHAIQSLAFFGAVNILDIAWISLVKQHWFHFAGHHLPLLMAFMFLFFCLLNFIAFVAWIVGMVQAGRGVYYRLPFVGEAVARSINWNGTVK